jgi:hypothetical protein
MCHQEFFTRARCLLVPLLSVTPWVLVAACAGPHSGRILKPHQASSEILKTPAQGKATIYFCRASRPVGMWNPLRVRSLTGFVVDVGNGSSTRCNFPPGHHFLTMKLIMPLMGELSGDSECNLDVILRPGDVRYICTTMTDPVFGGGGLSEWPPEKGQQFVKEHRLYLKENPNN